MARIYNQIDKADVVISDMSGKNPNVFYETGYAHALNKQVILLTQNADDIPFDLKHYPHIIYGGKIIPLLEKLEPRVRWCIQNPKSSLSSADVNFEFLLNGTPLVGGNWQVAYVTENIYGYSFPVRISIHNVSPNVIEPHSFRLALIIPRDVNIDIGINGSSLVEISYEQKLLNLEVTDTIFPDGWYSLYVPCSVPSRKNDETLLGSDFEMVLRLFTSVGPKDYQFTINPKKS